MNLYTQLVLPLQEAAHEEWIERARNVALDLAATRHITIDDVRSVCPPPRDIDPRVMGTIFRPSRLWSKIGYVESKRSINHNRPIAVWKLKDAQVLTIKQEG